MPKHLLLIDDDDLLVDSLAFTLGQAGYRTTTAGSAWQGLASIEMDPPDLILLDIGLPGMSGHEVARRLRSQPALRDVTLVALTGYGTEDDRRRSRSAGFDDHLVKPLDLAALKNHLHSLAPNRKGRRACRPP